MILQKMAVYDNYGTLYIRASGKFCVQDGRILIYQGGAVGTDTYMNAFDIGAWKKYTDISELALVWRLKGKGIIKVLWERKGEEAACLGKKSVESGCFSSGELKFCFDDFEKMTEGILYFHYWAEEDTLLESWFEAENAKVREARISLIICTYKRQEQLEKTLGMLREEDQKEGWKNWLQVMVADNASELEKDYGNGIFVFHNQNTGGSGGFTRGIYETLKNLDSFPATHTVFMDDDAVLQMESLRRLYALLTYMRKEYVHEVIAGRMFRADLPFVQYTAAEIWNSGDIRHIGWNQDMTDRQCLWQMNENGRGEYGGWWFACFPIGFVKENRPMPFFLHCDDVEYGLRHGGTPIILNGIQVWHKVHEYCEAPIMAYYDSRNRALVNHLYKMCSKEEILKYWVENISFYHVRQEYTMEFYSIIGFLDFMKGIEWLGKIDSGKYHKKLMNKTGNRIKNALLWRFVKGLFKVFYV